MWMGRGGRECGRQGGAAEQKTKGQDRSLGARPRRTMAGGHEADEEWQEGVEEGTATEGPCRM